MLETVVLGAARREWQHAVATFQRLDGGVFIHAKHGRMPWRIEIESDDIGGCAFEVRIVAGRVAL